MLPRCPPLSDITLSPQEPEFRPWPSKLQLASFAPRTAEVARGGPKDQKTQPRTRLSIDIAELDCQDGAPRVSGTRATRASENVEDVNATLKYIAENFAEQLEFIELDAAWAARFAQVFRLGFRLGAALVPLYCTVPVANHPRSKSTSRKGCRWIRSGLRPGPGVPKQRPANYDILEPKMEPFACLLSRPSRSLDISRPRQWGTQRVGFAGAWAQLEALTTTPSDVARRASEPASQDLSLEVPCISRTVADGCLT